MGPLSKLLGTIARDADRAPIVQKLMGASLTRPMSQRGPVRTLWHATNQKPFLQFETGVAKGVRTPESGGMWGEGAYLIDTTAPKPELSADKALSGYGDNALPFDIDANLKIYEYEPVFRDLKVVNTADKELFLDNNRLKQMGYRGKQAGGTVLIFDPSDLRPSRYPSLRNTHELYDALSAPNREEAISNLGMFNEIAPRRTIGEIIQQFRSNSHAS